jgi:tRNA 2-thiouridine synthesizing protein E
MTTIDLDEHGYLLDPAQWSEALAEDLAERDGLKLTPLHWKAIRFMRAYYESHQVAADARHVIRHLAEDPQAGEAARKLLFELFPYGYVNQACRIAGMRKPRAWSTG